MFVIDPFKFGSAAKTYDDFKAHIATLATDGVVVWDPSSVGNYVRPGAFRTTAANSAISGILIGSSWLSKFYAANSGASSFARVVQHGMLDEAAFNDQRTNGRELFVRIVADGTGPYTGITRNGYPSLTSGIGAPAGALTEIIYWDGTQAQRMQPSLGLGPTPYTW